MFEKNNLLEKAKKRKREKNKDASDIEGYLGPWAKYKDEETVSKPSEVRYTYDHQILWAIFEVREVTLHSSYIDIKGKYRKFARLLHFKKHFYFILINMI